MANDILTDDIDVAVMFNEEPPRLEFLWPGFLSGTVGALVSMGGVGKSFWALEASMAVAGGPGADLLGIGPEYYGPVLYLATEDHKKIIQTRGHAIGQHLCPDVRESIIENLSISAISGRRMDIMRTEQIKTIVQRCQGMRLLVIDTISRCHQLDENSNSDMAKLVSVLELIARESGCSVLYLHHISKATALGGMGDQQQAARGASALVDNARWCGYVAGMRAEEAAALYDEEGAIGERRRQYLRYGCSKINYGAPDTTERWYRRVGGGVLVPVQLGTGAPQNGGVTQIRGRKRDTATY